MSEHVRSTVKCEADCSAVATTEYTMHGQDWKFCSHHALKISRQYREQIELAAKAVLVNVK